MRRVLGVLLPALALLASGCIDTSFSQPETRGMKEEFGRESKALDPKQSLKSLKTEAETAKWPTKESKNQVGVKAYTGKVDQVFPKGIAPSGKVPSERDKAIDAARS